MVGMPGEAPTKGPEMGPAEIRELLQRETDAWNAHDPDGVAACYAQDAELVDVSMPEPVRGREGMRAYAAGFMTAFSDLRLEVGEPIVDGNRTAQEWTATGTHDGELMGMPATGRKMVTLGCGTAEIGDGGLVRRGANYWNAAALMQQLGLLPEAPATTHA
jgi:steroid delta-isomerase-like uncharacterized protein